LAAKESIDVRKKGKVEIENRSKGRKDYETTGFHYAGAVGNPGSS
jgi:hypothetical protein